ncbi:MAG: hypothetical protein HGA28_02945 [Anaerolineaceae bacterium]|nr:hypothetical protein [Anaerolineaceae bacterium]
MQFIIALLKKLPITPIILFFTGIGIGLLFGWVISPVQYENVTPAQLREDLRVDYLRMTLDSYRLNQDPNLAVGRWQNLGGTAQQAFVEIQKNPNGVEPAVITAYGELVRTVLSSGDDQTSTPETSLSPGTRLIVVGGGGLVLVVLLGTAIVFYRRLFGRRGSGEVTAVMQAAEISRKAEKTNFEQLGLAPPITQTMTTYILGDDLYDESFSIDTQAGEFMGEYGVGVSEAIGVGDPKKVTALEIWLFDKNDIKTATKVLMSQHAFNDLGIRSRLEPKGELVQIEAQSQVLLETATLQLLATVVDLEYGTGPMPANSYFERVTLELAIWPRQGL